MNSPFTSFADLIQSLQSLSEGWEQA